MKPKMLKDSNTKKVTNTAINGPKPKLAKPLGSGVHKWPTNKGISATRRSS